DSISRGFDANESSCNYGDNVSRVWATGDDHGSAFCNAGGNGTFSHAERLECQKGGNVTIFNDAASGADMLDDFHAQATAAKLNLSSAPAPRYVVVFMGHNDACTSTTSRTGNACGGDHDPNNYCRTTDAAFEREFRKGLDQLIQIPTVRILVLATARASELCNFESMDGCGVTLGLPCSTVWGQPFVDICRSLTDDCSSQRRIDMYETLVRYNAILDSVTEEYAGIPIGGSSATGAVKAPGVEMRFSLGPFQYKFQAADVSCCDCFHPSDHGQAILAEAGWNGYACSAATPCCAESGDVLKDARCDVEDHSSVFPGGFWPGNEHCGNGIIDPGEQCDDGNTVGGDCCSATCTNEPAGSGCPDDGNVCTDEVCDGSGACTHPPNGFLCDDGQFCTVGDVCSGGSCHGTPRDCSSAANQCNFGVCDENANACVPSPRPNGTPCNDGSACTSPDTCTAGTCGGASLCGDGVVQAGCEVCDDGTGNGNDACCSATCTRVDSDGDGACNRDDPCTGGPLMVGAKLTFSGLAAPAGDAKLVLRGDTPLPVSFSPPLAPQTRGVRLLLAGSVGVLVDATVPGGFYDGQEGWLVRGTRFVYRNRTASPPGGISSLTIEDRSAKSPAVVRAQLKTVKRSLTVGPTDLPIRWTLVLDPPAATTGDCGEVAFDAASPAPVCAFSANGARLVCR